MESAQSSSANLQAAKDIPVSKDRLYKAWVEEESLKKWWHPGDNRLVSVQNDIREGGTVRYEFQNEAGDKTFNISGKYQETRPGERLRYGWNWHLPQSEPVGDGDHILTVTFSGEGDASRIEIHQASTGQGQKEESIHPHQQGWEEQLESLKTFLVNQVQD